MNGTWEHFTASLNILNIFWDEKDKNKSKY